ncbi:XRE family transcriptional regulator [Aquisalimonas lutea]|uniref:XRE family transcriptional regulator n=1 Tax=Aquisalimonas lutea TaxID=1327750 RepID=UPI0025B48589|nr:XRE family transcriptional regulator [Aquisalimonas lutea]MDN3517224.1 XRE family transcriptional regulator [Aquisalimonas lutea]
MTHNLGAFFDEGGYVMADKLVSELHITKTELAGAIGLSRAALTRRDRLGSVATQQRLRQVTEILTRIEPWAGSLGAAWAWYRSYPIPPLGNLTAEELVVAGRAGEVHDYLAHIAEGGYA